MSTRFLANTRPLWVKGTAQDTSQRSQNHTHGPWTVTRTCPAHLPGPGAKGKGAVVKGGQDLLPP